MSYAEPTENERTYTSKPPSSEELLIKIYKRWRMKHSSAHIPQQYLDAAYWWVAHQEQPFHMEHPQHNTDSKGNEFWRTPYIDRIAANFRIFLSLDETHKAFVVEKIESGIPWRGDDMDMFLMICDEAEKMKQDKSGYIESALDALKNFKITGVQL